MEMVVSKLKLNFFIKNANIASGEHNFPFEHMNSNISPKKLIARQSFKKQKLEI
jgi:hypothetical protein